MKVFGIPLLVGIVLGLIGPGIAFEIAPVTSYILFFLLAITMIDIKIPTRIGASTLFDILSLSLISFLIIPVLVFYACSYLGINERLTTAFVLSSMAPYAMVAPLFIERLKGETSSSLLLIILSMVCCPFIIPFLLPMIGGEGLVIHRQPLFLFLLSISIGPLLLVFILQRLVPSFVSKLGRYKQYLASISLAVLVYALFGSAIHTWHKHASIENWGMALGFHFILDFVFLFLFLFLFKKIFSPDTNISYSVTLSMKNMAIPASLLLAYDPEFAFIPAFGFIIHAFYFNFLGILEREKLNKILIKRNSCEIN